MVIITSKLIQIYKQSENFAYILIQRKIQNNPHLSAASNIIKVIRTAAAKRCPPLRKTPLRAKPAGAYNLGLC